MSESKIINYEYQNQAADLIGAVPKGPIKGYHLNNNTKNQSWIVAVVGGNLVTFKNGSTGTYASPASESAGAAIVGSTTPYSWQQLSVAGGWYQFATTDGKFVWSLTGGQDYAPIVLKAAPYTGSDAQWGYNPALGIN